MPIPVQQFPILSAGQMSPFHQALQTGLDDYVNMTKAAYAPLTAQADAASKLTYANLMGPQFLSKLMGNEDILANLSPDQRNAALSTVYNAARGQGVGNAFLSQGQQPSFLDKLRNFFTTTNQNAQADQGKQPSTINQNPALSQADRQNISNMRPGDSYVVQGNQAPAQGGQMPPAQSPTQNNDTFFENTGRAAGIKKEGEELGTQRAKSIAELDDSYSKALNARGPIHHLIELAKMPAFQNLRKYPGFQQLQLNTKATFGTPFEQKMIGDFQSTAQSSVAQSLGTMQGRILDKEITMFNKMKVSPTDPINVMLGKLPSINQFNEMTLQRSRLASHIMATQHISKGDALEQADKMVNGEAIRQKVQDDLDSSQMVTLRNKKTGETRKMSLIDARKLGVPNV